MDTQFLEDWLGRIREIFPVAASGAVILLMGAVGSYMFLSIANHFHHFK